MRINKLPLVFVFLFLAGLVNFLFAKSILAVSEEECQKKKEENLTGYIDCLTQLNNETKGKAESLAKEVILFNTQIALTTAQISQSEQKIKVLEEEIADLSSKIDRLDSSLDQVSAILVKRISETYKTSKTDSLVLFLSSDSFSRFLARLKYLKVIQLHDKKLLLAMEETKTNYESQKSLKEKKQAELEQLKKVLESQKQKLAQQKKDKENLLRITQNDEKRYQGLLAAARAEQEAIEAAMRAGLALLKNGTPVEAGKEIALIGNSGYPRCSTGPHLHFEVRQDGAVKNPAEYLANISVEYDEGPVGRMNFTGSWPWPVEGPQITQEYGMSYWAKLGWYRGAPHTGIDMTSTNPIIRAPRGGTLYRGSSSCGGVGMNFVALDHGGGLISWYWHVQ